MFSKIKFVLISASILFIIITGFGLLFPSSVIVSKAVNIPTTKNKIIPLTHQLINWKKWVAGSEKLIIINDTLAQINKTSISILNITDSNIVSIWKDSKGKIQVGTINLFTRQDVTVVQWQFQEDFGWYPWQRFSSMFNEKILGPVMEVSLDSLKANATK